MPLGSPRTHTILQSAAPRCFHHPNTASSIPALEQTTNLVTLSISCQQPAMRLLCPRAMGHSPSLSHCCWMAACPLQTQGREGDTSAPQTQPQSSHSPRAGHTPPQDPSLTQSSQGWGQGVVQLPHSIQIPAAHPKNIPENAVLSSTSRDCSGPAQHRESNTSSTMSVETSEKVLLVRCC